MQVRELLQLNPFKDCSVRTGYIGLDNEIESAMVLEAIDIEKWGRKNQLILSSFFALKDLDQKKLETFFATIHEIGISGIILKLNRLIKSTPESMINLCYHYKIPLIEIKGDVNYERVLNAIYEPLLNRQTALLRTYYDANKIFSTLKNASATYKEIIDRLVHMISKSCQLTIPRENIVIKNGHTIVSDWDCIHTATISTEYTDNTYHISTLKHPSKEQLIYKITAQYTSQSLIPFTIDIYQTEPEFEHSHIMIVENAMEAIQHKLQIDLSIKHEYFNIYNNIAASIFFGTTPNDKEKNDLLEETNLLAHPYYQAIGIGKHIPHDNETLRLLRKTLEDLFPNNLYYENRKYIIILFNIPKESDELTIEKLSKKIPTLSQFNVVISSFSGKENIHNLFNECLDMIYFNREYHIFNLMTITDLGIFRHFLDAKNDFFNTDLAKNLEKLKEEKPELFDTFLNFILCKENYQLTAQQMFLHPKTVRYRISNIQKVLDFDIRNPIQSLNYSMATIIINFNSK
ncbi:PucR family transcriptional regulator [Streptococcus zalophi]|uniref:PucR family transcriptional regulator ligand-binding domain-containing protein n=1 Tax=Streptococcus zalophi TaxID=640031 RepID=A0A934PA07_9STRE|nr:PucR family transcriptional regulator ligand-binding domain-containing protein [Streptococcus zalophi]MBJ8349618.1 PucR family transcriptional regulator ligand-binding domain-containing protein [Streptococcus zalophi]MCR8968033.1 PucR family transcriptional regulator ligand-binding domain-containing protein [Streptococcus zalophi]